MKRINDGHLKTLALTICTISLIPMVVCSAQDQPAVFTSREFDANFVESTDERPVVGEAIPLVNAILGKDSKFDLQPSWCICPIEGKTVIPVFLGKRQRRKDQTAIAFVPNLERTIIIESKELPSLESLMGNKGAQAIKQPLVFMLAIALLHEVAHIQLGHSGCFDQDGDDYIIAQRSRQEALRKMERANTLDEKKKRELDADTFAAGQLTAALNDFSDSARFSKGMQVALILPTVSFNLGVARMLGKFSPGRLALRNLNEPYWDKGKSHPNFEYRMLMINSMTLIKSNPTLPNINDYQKLVDDFKQRREEIEDGILPWRNKEEGGKAQTKSGP